MDLYELNKIAGAIFGAALLLMVINEIGNILVHPTQPEKTAIAIETDADSGGESVAKAEDGPSLASLLAAGDAEAGKKVAKKCTSCHSFEKGARTRSAPISITSPAVISLHPRVFPTPLPWAICPGTGVMKVSIAFWPTHVISRKEQKCLLRASRREPIGPI